MKVVKTRYAMTKCIKCPMYRNCLKRGIIEIPLTMPLTSDAGCSNVNEVRADICRKLVPSKGPDGKSCFEYEDVIKERLERAFSIDLNFTHNPQVL